MDLEDASLEIERLETRLRAAEDVCVVSAWTPTHDSIAGKAAHELWLRWSELSGNDSSPKTNPHLTKELLAELAAKRDATRAATLAKIYDAAECKCGKVFTTEDMRQHLHLNQQVSAGVHGPVDK